VDSIIPIAAAFDAYQNWDGLYVKGGHYSVTDLLNPPRIVHLRNRHKDSLPPQRVEDMISAFQGNAWHSFLERNLRAAANKPQWTKRFLIEAKMWERIAGRKITGKIDCYDAHTRTLYDYKITSTWKAIFGDTTDYEIQLNAYAWFLAVNNFPVERIVVIMIHPDWNKRGLTDPMYPRQKIHEVPLRVWPFEEQEKFLIEKVTAIRDTEDVPDDQLPECTDEETWLRGEAFAIREPGKKRATRVLSSKIEVEKYVEYREAEGKPLHPDHTVEFRPGERTRCNGFCNVCTVCSQYAGYAAAAEGV